MVRAGCCNRLYEFCWDAIVSALSEYECCCVPLWPLVCYSRSQDCEPCGFFRFLPFLFTLSIQPHRHSQSSSFFFSFLVILFSIRKDEHRLRIDILYPLISFQFTWHQLEGSDYDEERSVQHLVQRQARYGPSVNLEEGVVAALDESGSRLLWTIDFRLLPILLGHWSPKRAWIMSLAPLPLYFSFRRKLGLLMNQEPSVELQLHVVPLVSFYYHDQPRSFTAFFTLFYVLYFHRLSSIPPYLANGQTTYWSLVLFPLLWVFRWSDGWTFSLFLVLWVSASNAAVVLVIFPIFWLVYVKGEAIRVMLLFVLWLSVNPSTSRVHLMLLFLLWMHCTWGPNCRLGLVLVPFLWVQYEKPSLFNGASSYNARVWLVPFFFFRRHSHAQRSVCLFPLFYVSKEDTATDRSVVWSVLMLLWFRASRSAHSPTTHKCCFLPPVFYCSSSACPRCF